MIKKMLTFLLCAAPVILVILVVSSTGKLVYDERNFVPNISLLERYGLSARFIHELKGQSPGPLYQFIYYPFKSFGIESIVAYRFINMIMCLSVVGFTFKLLRNNNIENAFIKALLLFAIPLTWTTAGLALTEVPAILLAIASVYALNTSVKDKNRIVWLLSSGILLSLSISARTPFLMILPAAIYFLYLNRYGIAAIVGYSVISMILPCIIFYIWRGLVPPDVQGIQSGIKPMFVMYTFSYISIFVMIIFPGFYKMPAIYYKALAVLFIILLAVNIGLLHINFVPMKSLGRALPASVAGIVNNIVGYGIPSLMWTLFVLHAVASLIYVIQNKNDTWKVFLVLTATFIAITTIKSAAQFSTRYPYQSFPFLLLCFSDKIKLNTGLFVRVAIGIGLGIISLLSYYHVRY